MPEERIWFLSDDLKLEGLFQEGKTPARGAVVAHPHPARGGTMYSNVVEGLVDALYELGFSTLRFNFRGAGRSEGMYDNGRGEVNDLQGAISCLRERGAQDIVLAGYSFGAWIISRYIQAGTDFDKVIFVAPPVSVYPFDTERLAGRVSLIICGDRDSLCPSHGARALGEAIRAPVIEIPRTDHFFVGREDQLIQIVQEYIQGS